MKYTIEEINNFTSEQFMKVFGNVIELYSEGAYSVYKERPFDDVSSLIKAFHDHLETISQDEQVHILRLHPDLAGRMAEEGKLTAESTKEQSSAGLNEASDQEKNTIRHYNKRYQEKFGFPFIICARENKVKSIIKGLMERYNNVEMVEIKKAIDEVKKICQLRILDLVQ